MPRNRRPLRWLLFLGAFACQPTDNGSSEAEDSALLARLDRIDERLTAIETKFDAASTKLEVVATWTTAQVEAEQRRVEELEKKRSERDARRIEREAQRRELGLSEDDDPLFKEGSSREIEGAAEGIQCTESSESHAKCSIDRAFLDHLLANPALLARQARVVPSQRDGVTRGFKLYGIRRGSLPKLLLIKNGDLIKTINDEEMNSIDQAMAVYTKLRRATLFDVEIERKGMPFTLEIEIF